MRNPIAEQPIAEQPIVEQPIVEPLSSTVPALRPQRRTRKTEGNRNRIAAVGRKPSCLQHRTACDLPLLLLFLFATLVKPAYAQFDDETKSTESPQEKKVLAALELAKMAAEINQPEISFEAVRRVSLTGPVISKVDLGGLLSNPQQNNSISASSTSNTATPQQQAAARVAAKMIEVNELWVKKKYDAGLAYDVWFEHVFPTESPNVIQLHSQPPANTDRNSNSGFPSIVSANIVPPKAGAQCLIEWAAKTDKVGAIEQELTKRLQQPGNAELGWLFKVWIADASKATSEVYASILAEIEPKMATYIVGNHSELKTHAIREALKKLPADSELKIRFKKAFLKALPTTSHWSGKPENLNWLRELHS